MLFDKPLLSNKPEDGTVDEYNRTKSANIRFM